MFLAVSIVEESKKRGFYFSKNKKKTNTLSYFNLRVFSKLLNGKFT